MLETTIKELTEEQAQQAASISSASSRHRSGFETIIHHESHSNHPSSASITAFPPRKSARPTGPHLQVELDSEDDTVPSGPPTAGLTVAGRPRESTSVSREPSAPQKRRRKRGEKADQDVRGPEDPSGPSSPQNTPQDETAADGKTRAVSGQLGGSAGIPDPFDTSSGGEEHTKGPHGRDRGKAISKQRPEKLELGEGKEDSKEGNNGRNSKAGKEDEEGKERGKELQGLPSEEDHFPQAVKSLELKDTSGVDKDLAFELDATDQAEGSRPSSPTSPKKAHKGKSRRASRHRVRGSIDKRRQSLAQDGKEEEPVQQQDEGVGDSEYKVESDATQTQRLQCDVPEATETEDGSVGYCPPCPACPPPPVTAEQEVQFGTAPDQKVASVNKTTGAQRSLIQFLDVEAQPSFTGLSPEEQAAYEETIDKAANYEEQVDMLTSELEELRTDQEESESRAHDAEVLLRKMEDEARRLEVENTAMKHQLEQLEAEKDQLVTWAHDIEMEAEQKQAALAGLEVLVAEQKKIIESYQKDKKSQGATTEFDIFGTTVQLQTDEITSGEAKTELQKLKTVLADFRRSMIGVLVSQNLIADIPSFPEQLRDTWNAASGAAEVTSDVKEHFAVLTDIIAQAFEHREAEHRAAFQALAQKKASEIERGVIGTDSSEDMRKVRLKLRQRVLELEVENSQMHDVLKTMTKLLEDKRANYEGQLSQKEENNKKQREEIRKMKDLAWALAEPLAKLREEGVARLGERKSLVDVLHLLQSVEQKVGKKIRTQDRKTAVPQMLVTGAHVVDPNAGQKHEHGEHGSALHDRPSSETAPHYGLNVKGLSRTQLPDDRSKESLQVPEVASRHEDSSHCVPVHVETADKDMSTSDRIGRAKTEITHFFLDPHNDWTVRSTTREVSFGHKVVQTSDDPNDANVAQLDENGQPLPTDGVLFLPSHGKINLYDTAFGTAKVRAPEIKEDILCVSWI
ncbi:hypothetical protein RvY_15641-2 [Ramazzottius varieornatus]|uniref:Uncharacterized protein n=1 Tax=Ramazzottius varieornatus TaxID=947166 RepID=A0A1D1VWT3_RAMVA|nr:hypothetical protein RvY_15641-2 [Ramazzottius varieornatus]